MKLAGGPFAQQGQIPSLTWVHSALIWNISCSGKSHLGSSKAAGGPWGYTGPKLESGPCRRCIKAPGAPSREPQERRPWPLVSWPG